MTRKHYVMLAEAMNEARIRKANMERTAEIIADALAKDNQAFDKGRFIRACGFETEE